MTMHELKIAILTYHFSDNYGALFQAYSLRQWFIINGVDADFLPYHPSYVEEGGNFDRPWRLSLWRKNATILYMRLSHLRRQILGDKAQHISFDSFRTRHLGISGSRLRDGASLESIVRSYDMLVCGSDQIWNPSIQRGLDPVYFLDIPGSEGIHKVAYAPSFGRSAIEPVYLEELGRLLSGLDAVSVREASGLAILEAAGFDQGSAKVVPDPTILLGQFDELLGMEDKQQDGSVFCYALRTDEVIRGVAERVAAIFDAPLYSPRGAHQRWRDIGHGVTPGPVDWLKMLSRSRIVVSNSFHGVALSVVLRKPFIAVALPGKRAGMNARVKNLLEAVGLSERLVETNNLEDVRRLVETPIDWVSANARIAVIRSKAEAFLHFQIAAVRSKLS